MTPDQASANLLQLSQAREGILRLTLNDPDRRNALSEEMLAALGDAFDQVGDNPDVQRGRMVNKIKGDPSMQLHERNDAADFDAQTKDKKRV